MTIHCPIHRASVILAIALIVGALRFLDGSLVAKADTNAQVPGRNLSAVAQIVFRGTSTLHDFEGRVMSQPFVLSLSSNTWSAQGNIFSGEMKTANDRRDHNMWVMLGTNTHPRLSGAIRNAVLPPPAGTKVTLSLRIRDRQLDLPVTVTDWSETSDAVRFHAAWDVSLKQYGLKPPSVLGVIRVGDIVHIDATVTATKAESAASPHNTSPAAIP